MKKILSILLAALMLAGVLASCGEQTQAEVDSSGLPASQSEEQATQESPVPESEAESDTEEEQATPEFEYEYVPPEDGSFTICGVPLEEYTFVLYFPGSEEYMRMNRAALLDSIQTSTRNATGLDLEFKVAKNEKMFTEKKYEHEILFGSGFVREGMPERNPKKNYYGVTEDGTVYFTAVCVMSYRELWNRFLAEFFGVPEGSGAASAGCSVPACYREYPEMNEEWLTQNGYSLVFADEFDGDALNMDAWMFREPGPRFEPPYFDTTSLDQFVVSDGILTMIAKYRTDGEFGEGFYGCFIGLRQYYCRGYFEARIKCSYAEGRGPDYACAFWIEGDDPYHAATSQKGIGPGGTEIDIMENFGPDYHTCCFWASGAAEDGGDGLSNELYQVIDLDNNYIEEYHTYSLLWTEDYYAIYLDGAEMCRTSFLAGTAVVEEQVLLSLLCSNINPEKDASVERELYVDYVRIWQKPELE